MSERDRPVELLALTAHPDDAELLCGGTLIRAADQGYRTGVLDLTGGESGSRGSREVREREAARASQIMGLAVRRSVGLPDGMLENTPETRLLVARHVRELRPRTVILHGAGGRHPDHRAAHQLGFDACFISGLGRAPLPGEPYRPHKILYCHAYSEAAVQPTFVVDITEQMERKLAAILAYESQFEGKTWAGDVFGSATRLLPEQIAAHAAHYGSLIRCDYGEPFLTRETMRVDDVVELGVRSI